VSRVDGHFAKVENKRARDEDETKLVAIVGGMTQSTITIVRVIAVRRRPKEKMLR
jgi:hypothetical protein